MSDDTDDTDDTTDAAATDEGDADGTAGETTILLDMDGVLVHEEFAIDGAAEFLDALDERGVSHMIMTNNSIFTPRDLSVRLGRAGLDVPSDRIWTSALATARFLDDQRPGGTAHVVGEAGLTTALHEAGYVIVDSDPDYVVLGETRNYSFTAITKAIQLVNDGARFIATNPDATGPTPDGNVLPATGSVAALITKATGIDPYFVGKPNAMMLRSALNSMRAHSENTLLIGDRMDTDIVAGLESGLRTLLVLSGSTDADEVERFPYRPWRIADSIGDIDLDELLSAL